MMTKKGICAASLVLCCITQAHAQVPVSIINDIPAMTNQVQVMAKWAAQYQQMLGQIEQMKAQVTAMTGTRGLGQIHNNPSLHAYLPEEWAGIYDKVQKGQLPGISNFAELIAGAESFDPNASEASVRQQRTMYANKAMTMQAYKQTQDRLNNINALMVAADKTQDAKAAADLQVRMSAENALIQNEQNRLALVAQLQMSETKLADAQRAREFSRKYFK